MTRDSDSRQGAEAEAPRGTAGAYNFATRRLNSGGDQAARETGGACMEPVAVGERLNDKVIPSRVMPQMR